MRVELIQTASTTGLNSASTICCSQKLDQLITVYQQLYARDSGISG